MTLTDHQLTLLHATTLMGWLFPVVLVVAGWSRFNLISFIYLILSYMLGLGHMTRYTEIQRSVLTMATAVAAFSTVLQLILQVLYLVLDGFEGTHPILVLVGCQL